MQTKKSSSSVSAEEDAVDDNHGGVTQRKRGETVAAGDPSVAAHVTDHESILSGLRSIAAAVLTTM